MISLSQHHLIISFAFLLLGLILEILQYFIPYRSFDYWDLLANGSGCFLAFLIIKYFSSLTELTLVAFEEKIGKSRKGGHNGQT